MLSMQASWSRMSRMCPQWLVAGLRSLEKFTNADLDNILDEKYLLRIDTQRKVVEHAAVQAQNNDDILAQLDEALQMDTTETQAKKLKTQ